MKLQRRTSGMRWTRCAGKQTMSSISIIHLFKLDKQKRRNVEEIDVDYKLRYKEYFPWKDFQECCGRQLEEVHE